MFLFQRLAEWPGCFRAAGMRPGGAEELRGGQLVPDAGAAAATAAATRLSGHSAAGHCVTASSLHWRALIQRAIHTAGQTRRQNNTPRE